MVPLPIDQALQRCIKMKANPCHVVVMLARKFHCYVIQYSPFSRHHYSAPSNRRMTELEGPFSSSESRPARNSPNPMSFLKAFVFDRFPGIRRRRRVIIVEVGGS
jgi:hypothetical protein